MNLCPQGSPSNQEENKLIIEHKVVSTLQEIFRVLRQGRNGDYGWCGEGGNITNDDSRLCARCWGIASDLKNILRVYRRNNSKYVFQYKVANAKTERGTVSSESTIKVCSQFKNKTF